MFNVCCVGTGGEKKEKKGRIESVWKLKKQEDDETRMNDIAKHRCLYIAYRARRNAIPNVSIHSEIQ